MTYVYMFHGKQGNSVLDNILSRGNYSNAVKGYNNYTPSFRNCKVPSEFAWMEHMFTPINSGRWTISQVREQFEKILGISAKAEHQVPVVKAVEVERKEPAKAMVNHLEVPTQVEKKHPLMAMDVKYKPIPTQAHKSDYQKKMDAVVNQIAIKLKEEQNIKPREAENHKMFLAVGEDPNKNQKNVALKDIRYPNPYLGKAAVVKQEIDVKHSEYYNPEKSLVNPVRAQVLNMNRRKEFDKKREELDLKIQQAMEERRIQKLAFDKRVAQFENDFNNRQNKKLI